MFKVKFEFKELDNFSKRLKESDELRKHFKTITREVASVLKEFMKSNTPVKTGTLRAGWDTQGGKMSYTVRATKDGYSVTLYNRVPYAGAVNYGHYSYNQFGGPYEVKNRTVPYYDGNSDDTFVYGHFFVEKGMLQLENNPSIIDDIIEDELGKWWGWCVSGK
jgi:hypothetical protein